jgi:phage terminase large subunit
VAGSGSLRNTFNAVKNGEQYPVDELISIDSSCPLLEKLKLELTTPHRDFDKNGRVMVESKKDLKRDVPSPNVADAFIMAFAPTDTAMDIWEALGTAKYLEITVSRKIHAIHFSTLFLCFIHAF